MKAIIEFPDWIDEDEFEFVGHRGAQPNSGEYVLFSLEADCWNLTKWDFDSTSSRGFCFRKKQKFVWPERFPDGSILAFSYLDKEWVTIVNSCCRGYGQVILPVSLKDLDKSKVYIKGENQ
jgi:hypothetical protein